MICAKTLGGFKQIRAQFASVHSLEQGGTEKYYLCLVHGEVELPTKKTQKHRAFWNHEPEENGRGDPRGRIQVDCVWKADGGKSVPFDSGLGESAEYVSKGIQPQRAVSFYEPIAWFNNDKDEKFTLVQLQIITGRRHQIRFHCQQIGHVLVGDSRYHDHVVDDRDWCPRVFLHSYCTKFREPFTERWFEATSPLPQDLGEVMEKNLYLERVKSPWNGPLFKSRRTHKVFHEFLKQYDPDQPLLITHDAPKLSAEAIAKMRAANLEAGVTLGTTNGVTVGATAPGGTVGITNGATLGAMASGGTLGTANGATVGEPPAKKRRIIVPAQYADQIPRTPPLAPQPVQQVAPPAVPLRHIPGPAPLPAAQQMAPQAVLQKPASVAAVPGQKSGWKRMESRSQPGVFYY
jgi:hypothetical protein